MFKVGDYVVRTEDGNNIFRDHGGILGKPYKVTHTTPGGEDLKVEGINYFLSARRFKLYVEKVAEIGQPDVVKSPSHYQFFPGVEAIEVIAASMSEEGFHGYCMGNRLKYRLRAGNKDDLVQDISKSDQYVELFNKHKHLCKAAK